MKKICLILLLVTSSHLFAMEAEKKEQSGAEKSDKKQQPPEQELIKKVVAARKSLADKRDYLANGADSAFMNKLVCQHAAVSARSKQILVELDLLDEHCNPTVAALAYRKSIKNTAEWKAHLQSCSNWASFFE